MEKNFNWQKSQKDDRTIYGRVGFRRKLFLWISLPSEFVL